MGTLRVKEDFHKYVLKHFQTFIRNLSLKISGIKVSLVDMNTFRQRSQPTPSDHLTFKENYENIYTFEIQKEELMAENKENQCTEYSKSSSYAECDLNYVESMLPTYGWNTSKPFWAYQYVSDYPSNTNVISLKLVNSKNFIGFASGAETSCLQPCTTHKMQFHLINSVHYYKGRASMRILVPQILKRRIQRTSKLDINIMVSLISGNIGFWLGLSVFQVVYEPVSQIMHLYFADK